VSSLKINHIEVTRLSPAETRIAMWRNGYSPLPCHGKRPAMDEWQKRTHTNEQEIHLWDRMWPYDGNTGCLTRNTPALDVDITDRAACRAVFDRIKERFQDGGLVLCRVGNAPKFSVPFRTSAPFKKFEATLIAPAGKAMKFEFLGDGQQFIVAGRHPDTGFDYRWWPKDRDLTTVPRDALPHIDEGAARALVDNLAALLINEHGFTRPEKPKERAVFKPRGNAPRGPRAVRASVDGLIRKVLGSTPDLDRNNLLFWSACRVNDMARAEELVGDEVQDALDALHEAALRTGLEPFEINRSIASAMRPRS
jgi:Bifunctional DNA primase/polymerase, N-terminal